MIRVGIPEICKFELQKGQVNPMNCFKTFPGLDFSLMNVKMVLDFNILEIFCRKINGLVLREIE